MTRPTNTVMRIDCPRRSSRIRGRSGSAYPARHQHVAGDPAAQTAADTGGKHGEATSRSNTKVALVVTCHPRSASSCGRRRGLPRGAGATGGDDDRPRARPECRRAAAAATSGARNTGALGLDDPAARGSGSQALPSAHRGPRGDRPPLVASPCRGTPTSPAIPESGNRSQRATDFRSQSPRLSSIPSHWLATAGPRTAAACPCHTFRGLTR